MTERPLSSEPAASGCGCGATVKFDGATPAYRRILMAVIAINGAAFLAIAGGAALQGSAALGANALDFLADDELLEITPAAWRLRKRLLSQDERARVVDDKREGTRRRRDGRVGR